MALIDLAGRAAAEGDHRRAHALGVEAAQTVDALAGVAERTWAAPRVTAALTDLARRLAFAGYVPAGHGLLVAIERLARTIGHGKQRHQALMDLASAAALSGDHARAATLRSAAAETKDLVTLAEAVFAKKTVNTPALSLESTADTAAMEEYIQGILDPDRRAEALAQVATECARAGETDRARRLAAEALAAGKWTHSLLIAYQLEPSVLNAIAEALLR